MSQSLNKGLFVALLITGPCAAHAESNLTGTDLQKALIGKTLASTSKRNIPYTITFTNTTLGIYTLYKEDSELSLTFSNDVVCFQSVKYKFQECNKVVVDGNKYDFMDAKTGVLNNIYYVK